MKGRQTMKPYYKLRGKIAEKGSSEKKLSKVIGKSYQFVSRCFNGKASFSVPDALLIMEHLGETEDKLGYYFGSNQMKGIAE